MCTALGYEVETLKRTRIMNITLTNLPVGKWRYFTIEEIKLIELQIQHSSKTSST